MEQNILIRFGALGDAVTAVSYAREAGYSHILLASNGWDYFFHRKSAPNDLIAIIANQNNVNLKCVSLIDIIYFAKCINKKDKIRLRFFMQSQFGLGVQLAYFVTSSLVKIIFWKRDEKIVVDKYYVGTQYPSYLKTNNLKINKDKGIRVKIWYDSKQPSKDLNKDSIYKICYLLDQYLPCQSIDIHGINKIGLDLTKLPINVIDRTGKMSPTEFKFSIDDTDLAVVVDSGPMHVYAMYEIPLIIFKGMRDGLVNWLPLGRHNLAVIYDDEVSCRGCGRHSCKFKVNFCVNSKKNLDSFEKIIKQIVADSL